MWFPDNQSLLLATSEFQKPGSKFFRLDLATGNRDLVLSTAKPAQGFTLSPDGKTLYYIDVDPRGIRRLVRYEFEARRETEISTAKGLEPEIAISPDGKQLAYGIQTETATIRYLAVIPVTGGPEKEIFRAPNLCTFNCVGWSPDGKFLLFSEGDGTPNSSTPLWRVPAAGGTAERTGLSQNGVIRGPQVHPDGKRVFYTVTEPNTSEIWALENFIPARPAK